MKKKFFSTNNKKELHIIVPVNTIDQFLLIALIQYIPIGPELFCPR